MTIKELISEININYMDADLAQLEMWNGQLSNEFAFIAQQLAEVKRDRAKKELMIKQPGMTEKEVERQYFATEDGQFYAYGTEMLKAIGKLISSVRFKADALRGKI